ncbi:2-dehydropantoate 2-reductase [Candidatus Sumerlaeota bacterium]|nr:2-dehydropantoate 2-reductase [Candidatus Sumerlaeota bacterium]
MRVLIYGGGAVGLGLASFLMQSGAKASIIARDSTVSALREHGLRRMGIFGEHNAAPGAFDCGVALEQLNPATRYDYTLVCVKSFDTTPAGRAFAAAPGGAERFGNFVLCQNGWGNREAFETALPDATIYNARVITGFKRLEPWQVEITVHAQDVTVGGLRGEALDAVRPLCEALSASGLPSSVTPHIERDLWAKMLYNCSLNPLGALFGVPYGALAECEESRAVMDEAHEEIFVVMAAAGYATHWPDAAAYQRDFYAELVPATARHHSSTLQDIRAGKRTEIDALNGAVVCLGEQCGVNVPVNRTLHRLVKFLEARGRAD